MALCAFYRVTLLVPFSYHSYSLKCNNVDLVILNKYILICLDITLSVIARAGGKTPRGAHVCSGASCYVWENFSGRVQMYDGCCSVTTKKGRQKIGGQLL